MSLFTESVFACFFLHFAVRRDTSIRCAARLSLQNPCCVQWGISGRVWFIRETWVLASHLRTSCPSMYQFGGWPGASHLVEIHTTQSWFTVSTVICCVPVFFVRILFFLSYNIVVSICYTLLGILIMFPLLTFVNWSVSYPHWRSRRYYPSGFGVFERGMK